MDPRDMETAKLKIEHRVGQHQKDTNPKCPLCALVGEIIVRH